MLLKIVRPKAKMAWVEGERSIIVAVVDEALSVEVVSNVGV